LCITLTCPYRRACPCLNPIHDYSFGYTRGILQQADRCSESSRACHYIIYLSERCCQSVCCLDLALCRKNKGRSPLDGNAPARCPAILQNGENLGRRSRGRGRFDRNLLGPIFFSPLPGFTATLSSKRSKNIIESRATIGFKSIVHTKPISHLLPFATTPHRASSGVPPNPPRTSDAP
jgi:hypothetical protein